MISMSLNYLIKMPKKFDNSTAVPLNASAGKYLFMRWGRKRHMCAQGAMHKMSYSSHNHSSLTTGPVKDAELVLKYANANGIENDNINFNFSAAIPLWSTISKYSNLPICDDIGLLLASSNRLKIQSRQIARESK